MTSDCIAFSTCRIQFLPNDQERDGREYSDRSLVELRQYDFANFSVRALDIENNKEEIFAVPLQSEDQYRYGQSVNDPDEVLARAGTYRLWLKAASRANFHEALNGAIQEVKLIHDDSLPSADATAKPTAHEDRDQHRPTGRNDRDPPRPTGRNDRDPPRPTGREDQDQYRPTGRNDRDPPRPTGREDQDQYRSTGRNDRDPPRPTRQDDLDQYRSMGRSDRDSPRPTGRNDRDPPRPTSRNDRESPRPEKRSDQIDVVADVYQLGQYISRGRADEASQLAKKLSNQHVQLEAIPGKVQQEEKPIQIRIKIDSNDRTMATQHKELRVSVYPSTTIAELRTAFACSKQFPSENQYFFVNGHLAHDKSTMKELDAHEDLFFILFVITQ